MGSYVADKQAPCGCVIRITSSTIFEQQNNYTFKITCSSHKDLDKNRRELFVEKDCFIKNFNQKINLLNNEVANIVSNIN